MSDGLSVSILSRGLLDSMRSVEREIQSANVKAVRAAGQALMKAAKPLAPVYAGPRKDVPKGRLRKAIKVGRVFRIGATTAAVKVGPRGYPAVAYAGKEEEASPYMTPAYASMRATLPAIAAAAYTEAINKGSRR